MVPALGRGPVGGRRRGATTRPTTGTPSGFRFVDYRARRRPPAAASRPQAGAVASRAWTHRPSARPVRAGAHRDGHAVHGRRLRSTSTAPSGSPPTWSTDGNDGLVISGTTGESPTTTDAEKERAAPGRRRGRRRPGQRRRRRRHQRHARTRVELARAAPRRPARTACCVVTPYYNKPPQDGAARSTSGRRRRHRPAGHALRHPGRTGHADRAPRRWSALGRARADRRGQGREGRPVRRHAG